jgi:xanthine dehydrogenase molybdopterin-binding subunit B
MVTRYIEHMATVLKRPAEEVREKNLYNEGDLTYYKFPVTKNVRYVQDLLP